MIREVKREEIPDYRHKGIGKKRGQYYELSYENNRQPNPR